MRITRSTLPALPASELIPKAPTSEASEDTRKDRIERRDRVRSRAATALPSIPTVAGDSPLSQAEGGASDTAADSVGAAFTSERRLCPQSILPLSPCCTYSVRGR